MYSFYTDFCFAVFTVLFSVISWYCILKKITVYVVYLCYGFDLYSVRNQLVFSKYEV